MNAVKYGDSIFKYMDLILITYTATYSTLYSIIPGGPLCMGAST